MMDDWFCNIAVTNNITFTGGRWISSSMRTASSSWSFSEEWKVHAATQQQKTWDMTALDRLSHFYIETKTAIGELDGKLVLDAGCGNGQLTSAIAAAGALAVGIDRQPHLPESHPGLQFVQCDFDNPPFHPGSFDTIIANGSIHHTKNTFESFRSLATLAKQGGKLYVWVYKKQTGMKKILLGMLDICRFFISRFPSSLQRVSVNLLTWVFFVLSRVRKGENSSRSKEELRINIYDAFTPRYRHYHSHQEVQDWFEQLGFGQIAITHSNNKYGFGMLGIKK